jgi:hypothetical protein
MKYRDLVPEELAALRLFAAENGAKWKEVLSMKYWYNARVYRAKDGKEYPILHAMRNNLGPRWLADYKLPPEEVPAYVMPVSGSIASAKDSDKPIWSGKKAPPKVGEKIDVLINGFGKAKVVGYFVQENYLGLKVVPDKAPDWFVKQNGKGKKEISVFGAEIGPVEAK